MHPPRSPEGRTRPRATRWSRCGLGWPNWPRASTLLENLRFDPGETANDPAFVARLIDGQDAYVNDAFGASHRAHASIVGPPQHLPSAAGRLLAREVEVLGSLRDDPERPFVAVMGGSKVSDKLAVIEALLETVDSLIIGGGMCFTFLVALGHHVGASLCEEDMIDTCRRLLRRSRRIHLPSDITALGPGGKMFDPDAGGEVRQMGNDLPDGWMGVDIGPGTAAEFTDVIAEARTILWNGPMGVFEDPRFAGRHPGGGPGDGRVAWRSPWSAAATAPPPRSSSGSTAISTMCPPVAVRRSS